MTTFLSQGRLKSEICLRGFESLRQKIFMPRYIMFEYSENSTKSVLNHSWIIVKPWSSKFVVLKICCLFTARFTQPDRIRFFAARIDSESLLNGSVCLEFKIHHMKSTGMTFFQALLSYADSLWLPPMFTSFLEPTRCYICPTCEFVILKSQEKELIYDERFTNYSARVINVFFPQTFFII